MKVALTMGELRKLPVGARVWCRYKEHGEAELRIDDAYSIKELPSPGRPWWTLKSDHEWLADVEFEHTSEGDDAPALCEPCGEGVMRLYGIYGVTS